MRMMTVLIILVLALLPVTATAEMYRWTDRNGNVYFADDLTKVPQEYRDRAQVVRPSGEAVNIDHETRGGDSVQKPTEEQTDQNGRNATWWKNRADDLRRQIRAKQDDIAFYRQQKAVCEESQKNIVGWRKNCAALYEQSIKRDEWEIRKLRKQLEVDLPEEARKSGAYPGWLRESP